MSRRNSINIIFTPGKGNTPARDGVHAVASSLGAGARGPRATQSLQQGARAREHVQRRTESEPSAGSCDGHSWVAALERQAVASAELQCHRGEVGLLSPSLDRDRAIKDRDAKIASLEYDHNRLARTNLKFAETVQHLREELARKSLVNENRTVKVDHRAMIENMDAQIIALRRELEEKLTQRTSSFRRQAKDDATRSLASEMEHMQTHLTSAEHRHQQHNMLKFQHEECPAITTALQEQIKDIKEQAMVMMRACLNIVLLKSSAPVRIGS